MFVYQRVNAGRAPPQTHVSRYKQLYQYLSRGACASPMIVHIHAFRVSC